MKISGLHNQYTINDTRKTDKKPTTVAEYSNYLTQKFPCLRPGMNSGVAVTSGLLKKAMKDEKTGAWLERELSKAPDYIKEAQESAKAHGATLKSVFIEFGEEYSTMITVTVTDGGGTDSEIDKWLEKIKEKKAEQKESEKRAEQKKSEQKLLEGLSTSEFRGKDMDDLMTQFTMKMMGSQTVPEGGIIDIRG